MTGKPGQPCRIDLTGQRFGKWQVLDRSHKDARGSIFWSVRCDCGTEKTVTTGALRNGTSKSCGCLCRENNTTHGLTESGAYSSWCAMKQRCLNPNDSGYAGYGGIGILICDRWIDSFENFLEDMGERPEGMSLDRYPDNAGNYEPSNCRWATPAQQSRNFRRTRFLTVNGVTKPLVDWATEELTPYMLLHRYKSGLRGEWVLKPRSFYRGHRSIKDFVEAPAEEGIEKRRRRINRVDEPE